MVDSDSGGAAMLHYVRSAPVERYSLSKDRYVLYVAGVKVLETQEVAVLLDQRLGTLITHGAPASVQHELHELRRLARMANVPHYERDWLLLQGFPEVGDLNRVLQHPEDVAIHQQAFLARDQRFAQRDARIILERIGRRR